MHSLITLSIGLSGTTYSIKRLCLNLCRKHTFPKYILKTNLAGMLILPGKSYGHPSYSKLIVCHFQGMLEIVNQKKYRFLLLSFNKLTMASIHNRHSSDHIVIKILFKEI